MSHRNRAIDQKAGRTCGQYPHNKVDNFDAPLAVSASIEPLLDSSSASAKSFPVKPIERKAIARVPARGPGPNMATNRRAHIKELIDREVTKTNLANRLSARFGVTLRAARRPTGKAMTIAMIVPSVAICSVSTIPLKVGPT